MNLKDLKNSNLLVSMFIDDVSNTSTLEETLYSISKQTYGVDFLVMHPASFSDEQIKSLKKSIDSPKITIRKKNEDGTIEEEHLKADTKINYMLYKTDADNFSKVFNEVFNIASQNEYEFLSLIEPHDIIGFNWYNQANMYAAEEKNISVFFPLIRNTVNGVFNGLLNEAPWAEGLAEEAGRVDLNLLSRFNCIVPLGGVFNINAIKEYSEEKDGKYFPFKESFRISHYYEFLMRMVYNDVKMMSIPRIGYELKIKTSNSFAHTGCKIPQNITQIPEEKGGITPEEGKFWVDLAKKEYFFDEDRGKTYGKTQE